MRIVALISTYKEEEILDSCIESAKDLDKILVWDGPINKPENFHSEEEKITLRHSYFYGEWGSDADKRTDMLQWAHKYLDEEYQWALWLDGDEILLWGQYLHDHCQRADEETATGGTTLRIVEYDGSVAQCYGKLIKLDTIRRYVMSSYEVELTNGMIVALPNVPICYAGGIPYGQIKDTDDPLLALNRPPLQGEPHLLHRHGLRDPNRVVPRLHDEEDKSFQQMVKDAGLGSVISDGADPA